MGAGRKTKTLPLKEKGVTSWTINGSAPARNLRKSDLGAVIFGCKNNTINECHEKRLFGLPAPHFAYVKNIRPTLPLFLFNYSDRKLHGIYEATSAGQMEIDRYGWTADNSGDYTPYGAQVRIKVLTQYSPLFEDEFKPVIAENYYEKKLFWFELDKAQTHKLISMFTSRMILSRPPTKRQNSFPNSNGGKRSNDSVVSSQVFAPLDSADVGLGGPWAALGSGGTEKSGLMPMPGHSYASIVSGTNTSLPEQKSVSCTERKWTSLFKASTTNVTATKDEGESSSDVSLQSGEKKLFDANTSGWASVKNDVEDQSYGAYNSEWSARNYNTEWEVQALDTSCEAPNAPEEGKYGNNSGWASVKNDVEEQSFEAYNSECSTKNYNAEWNVQALDTLCEAPNAPEEGKYDNLPWVADDVEWGHPSQVNLAGSDEGHDLPCLDGSNAEEGGSSASLTTPQPDGDGQAESYSRTDENTESSYFTVGVEMDYTDNYEEERVDPSGMEVEVHWGDKRTSEIVATENMAYPDVQLVAKLMEELEVIKASHHMLQRELVESKAEIRLLKTQYDTLESRVLPSMEDVEEAMTDSFNEPSPVINDPILIVGGFNGSSWLSDLCSYLPSEDNVGSLAPMSMVRKYSTAVTMNGELYVLGGADGDQWLDTVECYNPLSDKWSSRPALNQKKGSLAGASLFDKIFAIGGGNGKECFSNVEMLDLDIGRWIPARSMAHKRFSPAAAVLNGALYVVGGYDGKSYLSYAERFDPREHSWTSLRNMGTKRACHSLTVLNDKLYALGGFDGANIVSSTEIFDPRAGSWMMGESMNSPRGYCGAAVLGDKIHIIGGTTENDEILDTTELYEEGRGWEMTDLKAIGKRCFISAVIL